MMIKRIAGANRVLGQAQGYNGLPVRDEVIECPLGGPGTPVMATAWEPTPDELMRLVKGAPIYLRVIGTQHPPVLLVVGDAP